MERIHFVGFKSFFIEAFIHFNDKYDTHTYEVEQGVPWRYGDVGQNGFSQKYFQL